MQDGLPHEIRAILPVDRYAFLTTMSGEQLHLFAKGGLLHVEMDDAGEVGHLLDSTLHGLLQLLLVERHDIGEARHRLLHFPVTRFRRRLGDDVAQLVGKTGEHAQAIFLRHRLFHLTTRQLAQRTDNQRREAPLTGNRNPHILEGDPQHLRGGVVFAAVFLGDDPADFIGLFGEVELRQQTPQAMEQRADEGLFQIAHLRRGTDVLGEDAGQVGAQEVFLQLVGVGLVLQVLEKQHGDRDIAYRLEAKHDHGARHGADAAAAGRAEIGRIDQAQQLVGQGKILEDGIGQLVDALRLAVGDLVDRADRLRQRRKIALVAHAAEQEIDRRLLALATCRSVVLGCQVVVERLGQLRCRLVADLRIARQRLVQNAAQTLVDRYAAGQTLVFAGDAMHHLINVAALDGTPSGQHFKQDQAGGKDVRAFADFALLDVLRRHVGRRAGVFLLACVRRIDPRRDPEIHDPRHAVLVEQDIRRFQVTVDDAHGVRVRDRIENRPQKGDRLDRRQRAAVAQEFGQVLARHVLEDQVEIAALFARLENRHDIRVAQLADHARLVEQDAILRRIGTTEMQRLDGNLALQLRIEAEIDRALGTAPELATHLETTDTPGHSVSIQSNCATPSAVPKTMAF